MKYLFLGTLAIAMIPLTDWLVEIRRTDDIGYTPEEIRAVDNLVASLDCDDWLCQLDRKRRAK